MHNAYDLVFQVHARREAMLSMFRDAASPHPPENAALFREEVSATALSLSLSLLGEGHLHQPSHSPKPL